MALSAGQRTPGTKGIDLRLKDGRMMNRVRERLIAHVGGRPTVTQTALIDRAAMLTVHLARLDGDALRTGQLVDTRAYLTLNVTLSRILLALDTKGRAAVSPEAKPDTLADIVGRLST